MKISNQQKQVLDWNTNEFVCNVCRNRKKVDRPATVKEVSEQMDRFRKEHEGCKDE